MGENARRLWRTGHATRLEGIIQVNERAELGGTWRLESDISQRESHFNGLYTSQEAIPDERKEHFQRARTENFVP